MALVELTAGPIHYEDTGGTGRPVVLVHGVLMDSQQWRDVVPRLRPEHRCITPTLPLGAHTVPMHDDADLSLLGQVRLLAELLEALELTDAVLVFNDWAAPQLLVAEGLDNRVAGLVLVACETSGNYPPGLPGRTLALLGAVPGGLRLALTGLTWRPMRRVPFTFGWMAKRPLPDDLLDRWLTPARSDRRILRDLRAYVRGTRTGRRLLQDAERRLGGFDKDVLVVWAEEDRVMPMAEGRRLATAFPRGRLVTVDDCYTLIPLDRPEVLAPLIAGFVGDLGR